MKYMFLILTVLFIGCAIDTGINVTEEYEEPIKYSYTYAVASYNICPVTIEVCAN